MNTKMKPETIARRKREGLEQEKRDRAERIKQLRARAWQDKGAGIPDTDNIWIDLLREAGTGL